MLLGGHLQRVSLLGEGLHGSSAMLGGHQQRVPLRLHLGGLLLRLGCPLGRTGQLSDLRGQVGAAEVEIRRLDVQGRELGLVLGELFPLLGKLLPELAFSAEELRLLSRPLHQRLQEEEGQEHNKREKQLRHRKIILIAPCAGMSWSRISKVETSLSRMAPR